MAALKLLQELLRKGIRPTHSVPSLLGFLQALTPPITH